MIARQQKICTFRISFKFKKISTAQNMVTYDFSKIKPSVDVNLDFIVSGYANFDTANAQGAAITQAVMT